MSGAMKGGLGGDILKTTTLGGNPLANIGMAAALFGGPALLGSLGAAGAGAAGAGAGSDLASSLLGSSSVTPAITGGLSGMDAAVPAAAGTPLGMATTGPGVAGLFGPSVPGAVAGGGGFSINPSTMGKLGMNMMQSSMQQPQASPMLAQRPPGMQQQPQGGLPAPAMNQSAVPPPQQTGMMPGGVQAPSALQDILRRLSMGGMQ